MDTSSGGFNDFAVNVRMKISALWTSVMFCYIYADYFGLYVPGKLQGILDGKMAPLGPTTQSVLLGTSVMLAVPSVMIFLTLVLSPRLNRRVNIGLGALYSLIILATMWSWVFYMFYGVIEITLTGLIVLYAWRWPRGETAA